MLARPTPAREIPVRVSTLRYQIRGAEGVVELRGIEPLCSDLGREASPGAAGVLARSRFRRAHRRARFHPARSSFPPVPGRSRRGSLLATPFRGRRRSPGDGYLLLGSECD